MLTLYVVRHGQSESNRAGVYCGWGQVSLTEKGIIDALRAGDHLAGVRFDQVYTSDLKRAVQTCELALPEVDFVQSQLLREVNMGSLCGLSYAQALQKYGDIHRQHLSNRDFTTYGGENTAMQYDRTVQFLSFLEKMKIEGNVAVFCHEGTIKCMLSHILQSKIPWSRYSVDNGAVTTFFWNGEYWNLKTWNFTGKL